MKRSILSSAAPLALCAGFFLSAVSVNAAVTLPPVLGDHMVLQRDMPVPIWGTADPNEKITVRFRDQQKTTAADAQGKWQVKLDPLKVGEPGTLTVTGANTVTLKDVLVGEVWLGSGQSNLDTPVNYYTHLDPALKDAAGKEYPTLRLFRSPTAKNGWSEAKADKIRGFSAQLFYFGMKLQQELGVPVGLVEAAVAGSPSGPFLSQAAFDSDPDIQKAVAKAEAAEPLEARKQKYEAALAKWKQDTETARAAGTAEDKLPKAPAEPKPFSETKTGNQYERLIRPLIPFAIRGVLWDQGEGGAIGRLVWQPMTMAAIIRSWRADWGQGEFPWLYVQKPSGGGCALDPQNPLNAGAMPFVPLPKDPPAPEYFSSLRHEGYAIAKNPNTFLVVNSDLAPGVHPPAKSGYATRDFLVAIGTVYGKAVEYTGPAFQSVKAEGGKLRITFTHTGKGLAVPAGQKLQGFCVAGEDKKFRWAEAQIDGQTVVVSCPEVSRPALVRYAWTWPLAWANLFNAEGFPALGFNVEVK
jgi:sialate O-acetylesterase